MMPAGMGKTHIAAISIDLFEVLARLSKDAPLPTELCLFKAGLTDTTKGVYRVDEAACASVLRCHADYGNTLPFDYDHAMFAPGWMRADPARSGEAAAWFHPSVKDGAIMASGIDWTADAAERLRSKKYRYLSPAFNHDEEGRVLEIVGAALTNIPATKHMDAIMASRFGGRAAGDVEDDMEPKLFLALLGLKTDAGQDEVTRAITALKDDRTALLTMTGETTFAGALGKVQTYKTAAEQGVLASQQVAQLTAEVVALKADKNKTALATMIDGAIREGKLAPALKEWASTQTPEQLSAYLKNAPKVIPTGQVQDPGQQNAPGPVTLSQEQLAVAAQMGLSPDKFKEHVAKTPRAAVIVD
jgi:phage I-like protein